MKIQLSPTRIVKDAITVWYEHGPEVDMVMDLKKLTFAAGSIESLYTFHVLDHFFVTEIQEALSNWKSILKFGGELFVVVDDFEFIARSFIGGDITVDVINQDFSHPVQCTRDNLIAYLQGVGFIGEKMNIWLADIPNLFPKKQYELIISAKI